MNSRYILYAVNMQGESRKSLSSINTMRLAEKNGHAREEHNDVANAVALSSNNNSNDKIEKTK